MKHRLPFASASVALLLAACTSAPVAYPDRTLEELFDAERAFARASTERGIRASFLEYFAADGVDFRPGPGPMRECMLARPAPADPLALLLDWSPQAGAVARAGDLGFTTGPYSLRNQRDASAPARYGYFFSVWKRENGVWRVAVDAGVSTPAAPEPETPDTATGAKPASAWSISPAVRRSREGSAPGARALRAKSGPGSGRRTVLFRVAGELRARVPRRQLCFARCRRRAQCVRRDGPTPLLDPGGRRRVRERRLRLYVRSLRTLHRQCRGSHWVLHPRLAARRHGCVADRGRGTARARVITRSARACPAARAIVLPHARAAR